MTILVTGTAGFRGANFVLDCLAQSQESVVNLDNPTYAGNMETLASLQGDISDSNLIKYGIVVADI